MWTVSFFVHSQAFEEELATVGIEIDFHNYSYVAFFFTISICWIWYHCQLKQWITMRKKKLYNYCISLYYIIEFDGQLKSTFAYFSGFWSRAPVCVSVQTAPFPIYLLDSNRAVADFWIRLVSFSPQVWLMIISIFNVFFSSQCHPSLGLSLKWSFS